MNDLYASEADTLALLRPDQRSDAEKKLDAMLEERGAWEQGSDAYPILYQFALEQMVERESIMQAITDPENQPSQFGTVTMDYLWREVADKVAAERNACEDVAHEFEDVKEIKNEFDRGWSRSAHHIASTIRARGQS